jgi:hypothetical protein
LELVRNTRLATMKCTDGTRRVPATLVQPEFLRLGSSMSQFAKKVGDLQLVDFSLRNGHSQIHEAFLIGLDFDVIHGQEDYRRGSAGTFVSVHKRMVLNDVEQIRRGHFEEILME